MRYALLATALVASSSCYNPSIQPLQFTCTSGNGCPQGFVCSCGTCVSPGSSACDMGGGTDGMMPMGSGGCSNGMRVGGDPGLAGVAVCPAAWTVPGLTTTTARLTPCNRRPSGNGTVGTTRCSAEDNCAPGWHVCADEAELSSKGFTKANCDRLAQQSQLFVTRQAGGPPIAQMGPPECNGGMARAIFGCGSFGNTPNTCAIFNKVLVDRPNDGADDCSTASGGAFVCGGVTDLLPEITVVTKPMIGGGGVLCCAD